MIIRIDRSIRALRPPRMGELVHPELEHTGPVEYELEAIRLWCHECQRAYNNGWPLYTWHVVYDDLVGKGVLGSCLGLVDAYAIQQMGLAAFRKLFGRKVLHFARSVATGHGGQLCVPCLRELDEELVIGLNYLAVNVGEDCPTPLFPE